MMYFKQVNLLLIPKKGHASLCSKYCTTAERSGHRLWKRAECTPFRRMPDNLLDEQCGFRPNRSDVDALFINAAENLSLAQSTVKIHNINSD